MNYGPNDRQSTNVEIATPFNQLPILQQFILKYLTEAAHWPDQPTGEYPDPMIPQPTSRLDFGKNLPVELMGRFDWGQGLK